LKAGNWRYVLPLNMKTFTFGRSTGLLRQLATFGVILSLLTASNLLKAEDAPSGKKLKIGMTVPTLVNPFFVGMDRGVRERCAALGYELIAPNANNDMATQTNQVEDLLTKKVDVLIICPINAKAIVPVVKKANAAKIPVIALDRGSDGGELTSFIETDNVQMGTKAADWIAERLKERNGSPKGNVVNLQGLRGTTAAESREKGFTEGLKKYPDIKLVASQAANFDQERALNLMTDILQANSKIDAVFCANDDNAVGALKAIEASKRFKPATDSAHIFIIGIDGTGQALQAIRDGKLDATISQNPMKMAAKAVDFAHDISEGKSVEKRVYYPNLLLDKTDIDSDGAKTYGLWGDAK
jgi:ribose transport system substrate-binding protein